MSTEEMQEVRRKVAYVADRIVGKTWKQAVAFCAKHDLASRTVNVDGVAMMVAADCRMDRIGLFVNNGVVTATQNG